MFYDHRYENTFSPETLFEGRTLLPMRLDRCVYALLYCSLSFGQKSDTFSDCQKRASSQRDLQMCADQEFGRVDAAMTRSYQQLLAKAKKDAVAEGKIRAAQQSWLAFRDAQLEAVYPHEDRGEYGTTYPMCVLLRKTELTRQRAEMLRKMLNPVEGEVCDAGLRYSSCASAPAPPAANSVTDRWLGKWVGPEGTYLVLSKSGDKYLVEIHSLDGTATYDGTATDDRIEFQRNGKSESIRAGNGQETGMKWLLDKKNCLIIRAGEGFCRD
jgi:uncharacterized protein YecT (DUF1311 family)